MSGATPAATALMDRLYRRQRFIYDLTRRYYLVGRDRLIAELAPGAGAVLEVGCGTGRNLVAMARRYPKARLYGVDVSTAMLDSAAAAIARRRLSARVHLRLADATTLDPQACFGVAAFDRIVFSYTLCMIPQWRVALELALARLAPGGQLHIAEFGAWPGAPGTIRAAFAAWLRAFHVHPIADLATALAALATDHRLTLRATPLAGGYALLATLARAAAAEDAA